MNSLLQAEDVEHIAAFTRAATYVIASLGGILSIFLGYRLYLRGIESPVDGNLKKKGLSVSLRATGPGIFLSLFGMIILAVAISRPVVFHAQIDESHKISPPVPGRAPSEAISELPQSPSRKASLPHVVPQKSSRPKAPYERHQQVDISFFDGGVLSNPRISAASDVGLELIDKEAKSLSLSESELRRLQIAKETFEAMKKKVDAR